MIAPEMVRHKALILEGDPAVKSRLEELLGEGPYEIFFAKTASNGLRNSKNRTLDIATADVQLQIVHGKTGPGTSSTERIEARLLVVTSASPLDLTEEPLELDLLGKLDRARQKEEHPVTPDNSGNSRNFRKKWMESFLNTNYSNPDLCFDDVRREFRFTPSYGCRLFREYFGKTFREKLREIRIAQAERLIAETSLYMKEIAAECGFRSSKRLCEAFVRIHGISPAEYRKRYFRKDVPGASDRVNT